MNFYIKPADISDESDFHSVTELWNEAFGDDEEYIQSFLSAFDTKGRLIIGFHDNIPHCFMCLIPIQMRINAPFRRNVFRRGSYIYAACVRKDMRGNGLFRIFSDMCCDYIKNILGDEFAMLVPSELSLFSMYKKLGFNLTMSGLLPLCHDMPEPIDIEQYSQLKTSDFDGNYRKVYDFYFKSDEKCKLCLDYDLYVSALSEHADKGRIKYLYDFDTIEPVGYWVYESILQNGKEYINIYDIYYYGHDKGDIIYKMRKKLFDTRIREKALWRIFTTSSDVSLDFSEAENSVIFADILFEG